MGSNTLDSLSRAILESLEHDRHTLTSLAESFDALDESSTISRETLEAHVQQLLENGLVREVEAGGYELTDSGRRILCASPAGTSNDRIDTPPEVERVLDRASLRPDERAAVRSVHSFLRYWDDATAVELIDGCYSEVPAGYDSADEWWRDLVRNRLADLPSVSHSSGPESNVERWVYEGTRIVEMPDDADGRDVPDPDSAPPAFGSVRHGVGKLPLTDAERTAVRAAFAALFEREHATDDELVEAVYDDYDGGYDSSEAWTDWLHSTFDALPGIEQVSDVTSRHEWRYSGDCTRGGETEEDRNGDKDVP